MEKKDQTGQGPEPGGSGKKLRRVEFNVDCCFNEDIVDDPNGRFALWEETNTRIAELEELLRAATTRAASAKQEMDARVAELERIGDEDLLNRACDERDAARKEREVATARADAAEHSHTRARASADEEYVLRKRAESEVAAQASVIERVRAALREPNKTRRWKENAVLEALAAAPEHTAQPVPMVLHCPECKTRHIDEGEFATKVHHTHSCQGCGLTWRPAVVATVGVQFLPGFKNAAPEHTAPAIGGLGGHDQIGMALIVALRAEVERLRAKNLDREEKFVAKHAQLVAANALLARIIKYALEDSAVTPGSTRLLRVLAEADAHLSGQAPARTDPERAVLDAMAKKKDSALRGTITSRSEHADVCAAERRTREAIEREQEDGE